MDKKKKTVRVLNVIRDFKDRNGVFYKAGDVYKEISPERTAALMTAEVSELNRVGDIFLKEGE